MATLVYLAARMNKRETVRLRAAPLGRVYAWTCASPAEAVGTRLDVISGVNLSNCSLSVATNMLSCQQVCDEYAGCNTFNFRAGECHLKKCIACTAQNCMLGTRHARHGFDVYTKLSPSGG